MRSSPGVEIAASTSPLVWYNGGACMVEPTTVISLLDGEVEVLREGRGDPEPFGVSRSELHD